MATLTVELPDEVKALAEARAAEAGCADVGEYLARLIQSEAVGGPSGLSIDSDEELEALLRNRLNGPTLEMDAADFRRMRAALEARIGPAPERRP
jgi:hypothetical protein